MDRKRFAWIAGIGCLGLILLAAVIAIPLLVIPLQARRVMTNDQPAEAGTAVTPVAPDTRVLPVPTPGLELPLPDLPGSLSELYGAVNPGVVNIQVFVTRGAVSGQGAGSGFVLDEEGHIVTNNHVVADATAVTAVFYNGIEGEAEIVGTDEYSDLAIICVDPLPEGVNPLPVGDSEEVMVGEWVVAIGNPFSLGGSMSLGIVSAIGRSIPSGVTRFGIPQAIQTDAAINPGNSGGPLLNLAGEIIGVNAQIASAGAGQSAGVGFAIPSNIVRRVVPELIANGAYEWPWLGVEGASLNLIFQQANDLETQQGAYIISVTPGGPADQAGLQGSSGTRQVDGLDVPVGGDVVIAADGERILDFDDLLTVIASRSPGDTLELTIIRDGSEHQISVTLEPRP